MDGGGIRNPPPAVYINNAEVKRSCLCKISYVTADNQTPASVQRRRSVQSARMGEQLG